MDNTTEIAEKIVEYGPVGELVLSIVEAAHQRFQAVGAEDDFCLQHIGPTKIVFGGTNRVEWTAEYGFQPITSHCTRQFLRDWHSRQF